MFNDGDIITKVWMLLDIIHKAAAAGPGYTRWAQLAQDELGNIWTNTPAAEEPELPLEEEDTHG